MYFKKCLMSRKNCISQDNTHVKYFTRIKRHNDVKCITVAKVKRKNNFIKIITINKITHCRLKSFLELPSSPVLCYFAPWLLLMALTWHSLAKNINYDQNDNHDTLYGTSDVCNTYLII